MQQLGAGYASGSCSPVHSNKGTRNDIIAQDRKRKRLEAIWPQEMGTAGSCQPATYSIQSSTTCRSCRADKCPARALSGHQLCSAEQVLPFIEACNQHDMNLNLKIAATGAAEHPISELEQHHAGADAATPTVVKRQLTPCKASTAVPTQSR